MPTVQQWEISSLIEFLQNEVSQGNLSCMLCGSMEITAICTWTPSDAIAALISFPIDVPQIIGYVLCEPCRNRNLEEDPNANELDVKLTKFAIRNFREGRSKIPVSYRN